VSMPPGQPAGQVNGPPNLSACVRHPDRPTALRCTRCDRPACPECLRSASVGQHCVDCVAQDQRTTRAPVTIAGARPNRRPVVVQTLIAVNVLIFAITAYQARGVMDLGPSILFRDWALTPVFTAHGYWWQLVTAGFLHVNPIHILMNMFALWVIGRDMERILGPARFTAVYLVGLLGGSVSVLLFGQPDVPTVGASGAVFALMGGLLVLVYRLKVNPSQVIGMIAINLVISVAIPGISLLGHVGGLVTGALLTAALIFLPTRLPAERRRLWQVGAVVVLVVVLIGLALVRFPQISLTI
jgi:membrane associated rhomboid family serine protease